VVGIDRGVVVSAALSTGELLHSPGLTQGESKRLKVLQQRLARCKRGSNRRERTKRAIAKLKARERDRRKDWVEKSSADLARRFDVIRIEALEVRAMTRSARGTVDQPGVRVAQKRGLNRSISRSGWGQLVIRCSKAYGRVEQVRAAYTSLRCSACGHVAPENRQEPSGLRVPSLYCRTVQRRRQRRTQHRRRTGGDSAGRPGQVQGRGVRGRRVILRLRGSGGQFRGGDLLSC
jgi:putative transposase